MNQKEFSVWLRLAEREPEDLNEVDDSGKYGDDDKEKKVKPRIDKLAARVPEIH